MQMAKPPQVMCDSTLFQVHFSKKNIPFYRHLFTLPQCTSMFFSTIIYRVSQEERTKLREGVPCII